MFNKFLIVFFSLGILTAKLKAQGWLQPKNEGYFKLGFSGISASSFYGPNGDKVSIRTNNIFNSNIYAEYGLTNKITIIAYVPFVVTNTLNKIQYRQSGKTEPADQSTSFGDTDIALKYGLIKDKPFVLSATLLLGLPIGNTTGGNSRILQTGDGEFNQLLRADLSHSFYPKPFYSSVYAGFNNRTNNFSDEFRYGFDIGYTGAKWSTILHLNAVKSLFNGTVANANNGIFSNNTEYISPAIEIAYQINSSFGISATTAFAFAAKNVLAAPAYNAGVFYKLKNQKSKVLN